MSDRVRHCSKVINNRIALLVEELETQILDCRHSCRCLRALRDTFMKNVVGSVKKNDCLRVDNGLYEGIGLYWETADFLERLSLHF